MFKTLRPVGNKIILKTTRFKHDRFTPYHIHFFQSGTAALAAAIIISIRQKEIKPNDAEIIVPAYGCPDLISAIVYAGAKPVLVDLEPNTPWLSLQEVKGAISHQTCAIVAVNFLGIQERMKELTAIAKENNILLIGDSAQGFPKNESAQYWSSNVNIISFGRGKPINLLGGGALIYKDSRFEKFIPKADISSNGKLAQYKYRLKQYLYNFIKSPSIYHILSKTPGLNIGKTIYKPLHQIKDIQNINLNYLNANIDYYQKKDEPAQQLIKILNSLSKRCFLDLVAATSHDIRQPLLRYPILISNNLRDKTYEKLKHLGASKMYQKPLIDIDGVKNELGSHRNTYPNARIFADNLLTLPTHDGVSTKELAKIQTQLMATLSNLV